MSCSFAKSTVLALQSTIMAHEAHASANTLTIFRFNTPRDRSPHLHALDNDHEGLDDGDSLVVNPTRKLVERLAALHDDTRREDVAVAGAESAVRIARGVVNGRHDLAQLWDVIERHLGLKGVRHKEELHATAAARRGRTQCTICPSWERDARRDGRALEPCHMAEEC